MWDPYLASLQNHLPAAEEKIVFDKFHVAGHLGEAVDRVRRREHKALKAEGDERLTGTKYDWLRNPTSMDGKQRREFAELRNSELKTARAWALKETAKSLYNYVYEKPARKHFQWWYSWAVRSRLQPTPDRPAVPPLKMLAGGLLIYIVVEAHSGFLQRPGTRRLQDRKSAV